MSVAIPTVTRLQDQHDVNVSVGAGVDTYALTYDNASGKFVLTQHATAADPHTGYALLAGRSGGQVLYGGTAANDDITIHGTSDGTRTTSYVILQPTAGNVGIGTAAPTEKLQIDSGGIQFYNPAASSSNNTSMGYIGARNRETAASYDQLAKIDFRTETPYWQGAIAFLTANDLAVGALLEKMRITGTGNVGIGTIVPASLLHAVSTTATTNALRDVLTIGTDVTGAGAGDVNLGPGILFQAESSTTAAQDQARILSYWSTATHATMASKLAFQTRTAGAALATAMTIDGAGQVGIGTTAPDNTLVLSQSAVNTGLSFFNSNAGYTNLFSGRAVPQNNADFVGSLGLYSATNGGLILQGISDSDQAGMVVMGVIGASNPTDTIPAIILDGYKWDGSTGLAALGNTETILQIANGGASKAVVLGNGNVGIGTTAPATILHAVSTTATTNAVADVLTLGANVTSTGVGAAGLGAAILFTMETTTTVDTSAASVQAIIYEATHATRKFDLVLNAYDTAIREGLRIRGNGSAPALGFFGHAPAAQPSAYTPSNVSADRSFDADTVLVAELADVVGTLIADLQSLGLVA